MSSTTYTSLSQIEKDVPQADIYIAGSDQIWNCRNLHNGKDDAYFLTFAPQDSIRFSYAASLAMPQIPEEQIPRYRRLIADLDSVSVREHSGVELLATIGITKVTQVIDPTYLLSPTQWDEIADQNSTGTTTDYVLVYGYKQQKNVYAYARRLANQLGAKVYTINTSIEDFFLDTDKYFWNASPNAFVNLVKNARAVVTNSFHGMAFSIIYNIPFHFFTMDNGTDSRMLDALKEFRLTDRRLTDDTLLLNSMDYQQTNDIISHQRQASLDFLHTAVSAAKRVRSSDES